MAALIRQALDALLSLIKAVSVFASPQALVKASFCANSPNRACLALAILWLAGRDGAEEGTLGGVQVMIQGVASCLVSEK
jgi:hypothetical protein